MEKLIDKLANILSCCDRVTTTYVQDAKKIIEDLKECGYFITKNESPIKDVISILAEIASETINNPENSYEADAKYILNQLNDEGYRVISNSLLPLIWRDAANITVKGWAIVIYKHYDVQSDVFNHYPKLIINYTSDDDLIKGNTRAYLLCELTLPV